MLNEAGELLEGPSLVQDFMDLARGGVSYSPHGFNV